MDSSVTLQEIVAIKLNPTFFNQRHYTRGTYGLYKHYEYIEDKYTNISYNKVKTKTNSKKKKRNKVRGEWTPTTKLRVKFRCWNKKNGVHNHFLKFFLFYT